MSRIQRATTGLFAAWLVQHAGVPSRRSVPAAIGIFAGSLAGGHLGAYLVTKNQL